MNLRILPKGSGITADDFKTFTVGSSDNDVLLDEELTKASTMVTKDFTINKKDSKDNRVFFDFLTPFKGQNYCIERSGSEKITNDLKIAVNYFAQRANDADVKINEFNYDISLDGKASGFVDDEDKNKEDIDGSFTISVSSDKLNEYFGSTDTSLTGTFDYTLKFEDDEKEYKNSVPIKIVTAETCEVGGSTVNTPYCKDTEHDDGDGNCITNTRIYCTKSGKTYDNGVCVDSEVETQGSCAAKNQILIVDKGICEPCDKGVDKVENNKCVYTEPSCKTAEMGYKDGVCIDCGEIGFDKDQKKCNVLIN